MNLSEDLIRCISKFNPNFAFVNKEFNNYYKKINNAAKVIQKHFRLYRAKSLFGKCRFCGNYHYNEFYNNDSALDMYNYWYSNEIEDLISYNQISHFDRRTITIHINYDNVIINNKEKNKSKKYKKKNKYISKKQERRKLKKNFKYSNKIIRKNIKKNKLFR